MKEQLSYLYLALGDALEPLKQDFADVAALEDMFHRYGWQIELSDGDYNLISSAIAIHTTLDEFYGQLELLFAKRNNDEELELADFLALAERARPLIQLISNLDLGDISNFPEPLNQQSFWEDIAEHLLEDLIATYLQHYQPGAFAILQLFGAITIESVDPQAIHRIKYQRKRFDWDQAADVLSNPLAGFKNYYHWDDPVEPLDHRQLLHNITRALRSLLVAASIVIPDEDLTGDTIYTPSPDYAVDHDVEELRIPYVHRMNWLDEDLVELGLSVYPITDDPLAPPNGLLLRPVVSGALAEQFELNRDFELVLGAGVDAGNLLAIKVFPGNISLASGDLNLAASIGLRTIRTEPWYLFGRADTTRMALHGFQLETKIAGTVNDPEVILQFKAITPNGGHGLQAALQFDQADGFLQKILGNQPIEVGFSPEIIWSSQNGITINGKPDLNVQFKLDQKIGGVTIKNVQLSLLEGQQQTSKRSLALRTAAEIGGKIGPLSFVVEKTGFQLNLIPYSRQDLLNLPPDADPPFLGNLGLDLDFTAPQGISLQLDTDVVGGGGYLFFDSATEQYAGILQLAFSQISLQAIGLITTRMPDGSKGFSMVLIISAEGFTPIQLGFGFTLVKVGGLLGINRTVATEVLRQGLKGDSLDSVLFPIDPLDNAAQIISDLRATFPPASGQHVFGPMVEIVWGRPVMLRMKLGIVLEFPTSPRLHILGRFQAGLPSLSEPLVRLNMDALGTVHFEREEIALDAVLYDSTLLDTITLTGGMALRAGWGYNPQFILSVGGFNPRFPAPAGFPNLERITFSLANRENGSAQPNPLIEFKAYFALTSNTAQVGASFYLFAEAIGFSVEGDLRFHALFEFSPFQFIVDIFGAITLQWQGMTLLAVRLSATLSGPTPWYVRGDITVDTFLFDVSLSFEKQFGIDTPPPLPPAVDPLPELIAALEDVRSWEAQTPGSGPGLVTLRQIPQANDEVLLDPQGELSVRQTVLPLEVEITRFGNSPPANDRRFNIELYLANGSKINTVAVEDYFAPAQFREMSDAQKISEPSFEKMKAGLRMLSGQATHGSGTSTPVSYETLIIGDQESEAVPQEIYDLAADKIDWQAGKGASAQSPLHRQGRLKYRMPTAGITRQERKYRLVSMEDLTAPADAGPLGNETFKSFTAAAEALGFYLDQHPDKRDFVQIIASHLVA